LHLLYARFWTKVMRDLKLVHIGEPFSKLLTQGMVLNEAFSSTNAQGAKEYHWASDLHIERDEHMNVRSAAVRQTKQSVHFEGWTTMSKSKNNGVDPQTLIEQFGADTARLFVMFAAPPEQTLEWNDAGVEGAHRFLRRVWSFCAKHAQRIQSANGNIQAHQLSECARALRFEVHTVLRQISHDFERMQYNTVVSGAMKLLNALEGFEGDEAHVVSESTGILLRALYPVCPHLTWMLWRTLGFSVVHGDLLDAPWPQVDAQALVQDEVELMLQVNGKLRGAIKVAAAADKASIEALALAHAECIRFLEGRTPKRVIIVPGRLVNVVG
jgi:leucyl-tRNA synthetase